MRGCHGAPHAEQDSKFAGACELANKTNPYPAILLDDVRHNPAAEVVHQNERVGADPAKEVRVFDGGLEQQRSVEGRGPNGRQGMGMKD